MSASEFAGKRVFMTDGSKRVNKTMVRRFASGKTTVGTTARSPLPEGNAAKLFVQTDISTRTSVDKAVRDVLDEFGRLDILIHNAGGSGAAGDGSLRLSDTD